MDFESLSKDQQNKLLSCKTSEDLLAAVSQEGIELTDAQLEQVSGGWDSTESAGTCPFTLAEARRHALADGRVLDDAELANVAGGGGFCHLIDGSGGVEAKCGEKEGHACAYVGVTIPDATP